MLLQQSLEPIFFVLIAFTGATTTFYSKDPHDPCSLFYKKMLKLWLYMALSTTSFINSVIDLTYFLQLKIAKGRA